MSDTAILINTAVAVVAIVVLIVRFKLNPLIALVLGSCYLGLAAGSGCGRPSRRWAPGSATSWPRSGC